MEKVTIPTEVIGNMVANAMIAGRLGSTMTLDEFLEYVTVYHDTAVELVIDNYGDLS